MIALEITTIFVAGVIVGAAGVVTATVLLCKHIAAGSVDVNGDPERDSGMLDARPIIKTRKI